MSRHWRVRGAGDCRFEVRPHPSGPWLVVTGRRVLAVSPEAGRALLPLHGRRVPAMPPPPRAVRGPALRTTLVPAPVVRALAAGLAPLASGAGLAFTATAGLAAVACLRPWDVAGGFSVPALLLVAAGALLHELGHAAALRRSGYAPGAVGVGVLVIVPVLFADVSAVRLLPRAARVRVDLAGPAFQAGAAGALAVTAAVGGPGLAPHAGAAAVATLAAIAWSLLPLARSDGVWALRDALGPPRGSADPQREPSAKERRLERALSAVRLVTAALACVLLPPRVAALLVVFLAGLGLPVPPPARGALAAGLQAAAVAALAAALLRALSCSRNRHRREGMDARAGDEHPEQDDAGPRPLELDGVLDLHMFPPAQARALIDDWLDASREAGLRDLRIIHGKGIGALRELVHAALAARDDVESYGLATDASSWGATVVRLKD